MAVQPLKIVDGQTQRVATSDAIQLSAMGLGAAPTSDALTLTAAAASNRGVLIKGAASQTANLLEIQSNGGSTLYKVEDGGVIAVTDQSGDPSNEAGFGKLYTKDTSAISELFYLDDTGQVIQITSNGVVNAAGGGVSDLQGAYDGGNTITLAAATPIQLTANSATDSAITVVTGIITMPTAMAIGNGSHGSAGTLSTALGSTAVASGNNSVAFGTGSAATGSGSIAIGDGSTSAGVSAGVAIGRNTVTASSAVAIGDGATSSAGNCVALGSGAETTASSCVAIGGGSDAKATNAIAIGQNSSSDHADSIVFGKDVNSTAANQFVAGDNNAPITAVHFGNGVSSATPTTSVTMSPTSGAGTNISATDLILVGGRPSGSGVGGSVIFQTAAGTTSGTTVRALATRLEIDEDGNIGVFGTTSFGSGTKVMAVANATTVPTTNPTAGGILYAESGAAKWRGSSGTVTTLGVAEPHCQDCGRDCAVEWENEEAGWEIAVCMWCFTEAMGNKGIIRKIQN